MPIVATLYHPLCHHRPNHLDIPKSQQAPRRQARTIKECRATIYNIIIYSAKIPPPYEAVFGRLRQYGVYFVIRPAISFRLLGFAAISF